MRNNKQEVSRTVKSPRQVRRIIDSVVVMDDAVANSSISRSRKKIFEGRSKSVKRQRQSNKVTEGFQSNVVTGNSKQVLTKMEEMQQQISQLTQLLQQKQKREQQEQRKINEMLDIKNKEAQVYVKRIEQLNHELDYKNRQLESYRLEIQRLLRCSKLHQDNEHLTGLIEADQHKNTSSFLVDIHNKTGTLWDTNKFSAGLLEGNNRLRSISANPSPEKFKGFLLDESSIPGSRPHLSQYLSPFNIAESTYKNESMNKSTTNGWRNSFQTKENNLMNQSVRGVPTAYPQVVVHSGSSPAPVRDTYISPFY